MEAAYKESINMDKRFVGFKYQIAIAIVITHNARDMKT